MKCTFRLGGNMGSAASKVMSARHNDGAQPGHYLVPV